MKRLKVYTSKLSDFSIESLNETASKMPCPEPTNTKPSTIGFVKPFEFLDNSTNFVEGIYGYGYTIIQIKEKKAARKHVTALLKARLKKDRDSGTTHTEKERRAIRKQIEEDCIKTALPEETNILCVFDFKNNEIWLSTSSSKAREKAKELLLSIPINLMERSISLNIEDDLTTIINDPNKLIEDMDLGHKTSMRELSQSASVNYRSQDLGNKEIETNIECNKLATQLELDYKSSIKFVINSTQEITGIKVDNDATTEWLEINSEASKEDELDAARETVAFRIMVLEQLLPKIFSIFENLKGDNDFVIT